MLTQAHLTRRAWLKSSAFTAAVLALGQARLSAAAAPPERNLVRLGQNENPYGISKKAEQAILDALRMAHRYPNTETPELRDLIAEREGVPRNCVVLGAGCTEIFSLAALLHGAEGKEVVVAEPTYSGFDTFIQNVRGKLVRVPVNDRFELDLPAMARRVTKQTGLVYVCNPNNPTGTIVEAAKLGPFCEEMSRQALVLVDEAYHELVEDARHQTMVGLVKQGANVLVVRTFSKLYGLAGLRVGYGIAQPAIASELRRIQTTFLPLSQLSLAAARATYLDAPYLASCKQRNLETRAAFYQRLGPLGAKPIEGSQTNFVTFLPQGNASRLVSSLARNHGIAVRSYQFLGRSWVRVSMGTPEEMDKLAAALRNA